MSKQIVATTYGTEDTLFDFKKQMLDVLSVFNKFYDLGADSGPNYMLAKHSIAYIRKFMGLPWVMDSDNDETKLPDIINEVRYYMSLLKLKKEILQNGHVFLIKAGEGIQITKPNLSEQERRDLFANFYSILMGYFENCKKELGDELKIVEAFADFLQDESLWDNATSTNAWKAPMLNEKLNTLTKECASQASECKTIVGFDLIQNAKVSKDTKRRFRDIMAIRKRTLEGAISWIDERLSIYETHKDSALKNGLIENGFAKRFQKEVLETQSEIGKMLEKARHDLSIYTYGLKLLRGDILEELYL